MKIDVNFQAKEYHTAGLTYTFNERDFFKTDVHLTLMPDIFIQDFEPRTAPLMTQVQVRMFVVNVNFDNHYWCLTHDGQLTQALLRKEVIPKHNMERVFLYCQLEAQYFPRKLYLNILSNSGQSQTKVDNYVEYHAMKQLPDPYDHDKFFMLAQVTDKIVTMGTQTSVIIPTITFVSEKKAKIIKSIQCLYGNEVPAQQGTFNFETQRFNCTLPTHLTNVT
jgi:hypothetical protein